MSDLYKISGKVVKVDGLTLSTDSSGNLETIRATDNEAIAGTDTNKALTPASGLALVTNQIDQRLTNALIYRGSWAITTSTTDYSGLNSYRPIKAGDYFRITGTGPAIIDGVEYNPNDSIIFNQACSATTTITTAMIDHQDHTDASDTVYENATQTLTNKTIDADDNTISDLETDNFKSGVVVTTVGPSSGSGAATNNELPTALAVRSAINAATPSVDNVTIELGGSNNDTLQVKDQGISISKISSSALVLKTNESQSNATIPSYEKVSDMISSATPVVDGTTISLNTSSQLQADGLIEKNQSNAVYDWVGTYAEYQAAKQNNQILDSWICFITDDSFVADPNKIVMTDTAQTITGNKSFTGTVQVPTSSADVGTSTEAVNVKYLYDEGYSALRSNTANIDLSNLSSTGKGYVGIKGYDSTATYSLNEVVLTVVSGSVLLYRSLVDNNTASLSDTTKWEEVELGGGGEINTPFFFGQSMYSENVPYNASWLVSNGSYNASSLYADFWVQLTGVELNTSLNVGDTIEIGGKTYVKRGLPVVLSTGTITDYDFVVNQNDQTFRLPLLNGEEDLPGKRQSYFTVQPSGTDYNVPANGWVYVSGVPSTTNAYIDIYSIDDEGNSHCHSFSFVTVANYWPSGYVPVKKGWSVKVRYANMQQAGQTYPMGIIFTYATGNGTLYYYVGDTVQDASLINAGVVLGQLANKADIDASNFNTNGKSLLSGLGMPDIANAQLVSNSFASSTNFTAPTNGWYCCRGMSSAAGHISVFMTSLDANDGVVAPYTGGVDYVSSSGAVKNEILPVLKGTKIQVQHYNCNLSGDVWCGLWFIPAKGEN